MLSEHTHVITFLQTRRVEDGVGTPTMEPPRFSRERMVEHIPVGLPASAGSTVDTWTRRSSVSTNLAQTLVSL